MKQTIEHLDYIYQLIKKYENAYEENVGVWGGDTLVYSGVAKMFEILPDEVNFAVRNSLISEDMAQEYRNVLVAIRDRNIDVGEGFQKLKYICNQQTEDCEKADRQMSEAFSFNWKNDDTKVEDSKKSLEHIKDLTRFYESGYSKEEPLESVNGLCELVGGIKEEAENKNISEKTANELLGPLNRIRNNFFDKNIQKQEIQNFNNILQKKLNANENTSQRGALDTIIDGISALRSNKQDERNMQQTDVARTQGEADQALEKQRLSAQEKSGNGNEAQEKALREQTYKNKEQIQQQSIDPKLKEEFNHLKQEILRRYYRAKNYAEVFLGERSRPLLRDVAEEFERLARSVSNIDLDKDYDKKALEEFGYQWREAMISLPIYYRELEKLDAAYEDVWGDFDKLNNIYDNFLKNILETERNDVESLNKSRTEQQTLKSQVKTEERPRTPFLGAQKKQESQLSQEQRNALFNGKPKEQKLEHQEQKRRPLSRSELEDIGRARIEAFKEKYDLSINGRKKYNEEQWEQILDQELGFTDIEDTFRSDFVKGMMGSHWKDPEIRKGVRVDNIPEPSIKAQIDAEYNSRREESNLGNIISDKNGLNKEEARRKIESFILNYDNLSSNNPGEANYELDKFSKYISGAMKDGLISQQEAKQYKDIINNAYTNKESASKTVEKLWNLHDNQQKKPDNLPHRQQSEQKIIDSQLDKREDLRTKTTKDVTQKQDEVDKALETQRQASKENPGNSNGQQEKAIREQVVNNEEQKSQDKFAVFRQQLERKVPLERDENTDNKKIDRPEAFKKGSENVKKLAQLNQQKTMAYYMKKRKNEWSDY